MNLDLNDIARNLHRSIRTMPKLARQFAYNLIELIECNAMAVHPMGDHEIQQPRRLLEWQMAQIERVTTQHGNQ